MATTVDDARMLAATAAERDLALAGARLEDIALIDEIARRMRDRNFTAAEVFAASELEAATGGPGDLGFALHRALGAKAGALSLGKLLGKLSQTSVVKAVCSQDGSRVWSLHWPHRVWGQTGD